MTTATVTDLASVEQYGARGDALGFPLTDLSMTDGDIGAFVARVLARYSAIVNRLAGLEASAAVDRRWVPVLVALDVGQHVTFTRRGIEPDDRVLEGFVTGWEHRMQPNRFDTTIHTTTITRSF